MVTTLGKKKAEVAVGWAIVVSKHIRKSLHRLNVGVQRISHIVRPRSGIDEEVFFVIALLCYAVF